MTRSHPVHHRFIRLGRLHRRAIRLLPLAIVVPLLGLSRPASQARPAAGPPIPQRSDQAPGPLVFTDITAGSQVELFTSLPDGSDRRQRSTSDGVVEAGPSWAPDGRRIAFTAQVSERNWALHSLDLDSREVTPITQGPLDYDPAWSPKGDLIAFAAHFELGGAIESSTLSITPPDGLGIRPLLSLESRDHAIRHPTWAPDAGRLAFSVQATTSDAELYAVGADGSDPHRLLANPGWDDVDPAWSPDGRRIAFASGRFEGSTANTRHAIWLLDLATGTRGTIVADPGRDLRRPAWSPDGARIVFDARTGTGASARWDLHIVPAAGGALGTPVTSGREPDWAAAPGTRPTATPTPTSALPTAPPTATGPTPTGPTPTEPPTNTPPPVPTFPSFPTLVPFPTFPPPEPTLTGPAPTYPPPTPTPSRTSVPSATPTASRTPTASATPHATTPAPTSTPGGPGIAYLPIAYLLWPEPTPTPEASPTPTPEASPTSEVTPSPEGTPTVSLLEIGAIIRGQTRISRSPEVPWTSRRFP